jgi:hypothetical protein
MRCLIFILLVLPFCSLAQNKIAFLSSTADATTSIFDKYPSADNNKFLTDDGLIFIEASVNGEKGIFLLDTGAPTLVLNSSTSELSASKSTKAFAVSSDLPVSFVQINQFEWGNFKKDIFEGLMLDLNHFEGPTKTAIDGLVGFDILDSKVLMVDFKDNRVALLKYRDFKSIKRELAPSYSIPFKMHQHLPVLTITIENKEYKLALDTGAEINLLHAPLLKEINVKNIEYDLLQGLDKHIRKVAKGNIQDFSVNDYKINQSQFLFTDLSHIQNIQYGYDIDGLLGLSFFEGRQFAIDYKKQEIHIW